MSRATSNRELKRSIRVNQKLGVRRPARRRQQASPHQHRGDGLAVGCHFDAPEVWHEPKEDGELQIVVERPGSGYTHVVTAGEIRDRVEQLPAEYRESLDVVQLSRMTRKRRLFPCYGLQWGTAVYLYPIEESLQELYTRPPRPAQRIETEMFGGRWVQDGAMWRLIWTFNTVRDYVLNNVLIHEIGHINDSRNTSFRKRERFADWFAIEYGYRATGGKQGRVMAKHTGQR
ncbi:MAG: hypothetical protein KDA85_22275 [Planctomycetaceae bacterium]|nr:hypothetical protein [Planctomycetaceae bacterium]